MRDQGISSDIGFGVWASVVLIELAIVSVSAALPVGAQTAALTLS
jgi:hypothetical protein